MTPDKWRAVSFAHRGELLRSRSGIWNFAWAAGADFLVSRTSAGLLSTTISKKGVIKHTWFDAPERGFSADVALLREVAA
jgi:hypothetical protein